MTEWDVVSESHRGKKLLLGEAKWSVRPFRKGALERLIREVVSKPPPVLPRKYAGHEIVRAVFVPALDPGTAARSKDAVIVTLGHLTSE